MGRAGANAFANMAPMSDAHVPASELKSALVRAIEARTRKAVPFVLAEFADLFDGQPPTVWVRVATLAEQDDALVQAYAYIAKKAAAAPLIERDAAFVDACKTSHILAVVFRESAAKDSLPAFPDAEWNRDNFTPYQIQILLDRYNSVVQMTQPGAGKVEPEWVAELAMKCAEFEGTNIPDLALGECSKSMLAECFIRLAMFWKTERDENAALRAAVEAYESQAGQSGSLQPANPHLDESGSGSSGN